MSDLSEIRAILEQAHAREKAAPRSGYDLAIADIKAAGIAINRGLTFDLVVHLEKRKDERWPSGGNI
jgi:hypothetical protein